MAALADGVCSAWATLDDLPDCPPVTAAAPEDKARMLDLATDLLFRMSGEQWPGLCETVVRPCGRARLGGGFAFHGRSLPVLASDQGWWLCSCSTADRCGCGSISQIRLPGGPIVEVTQVRVDGVTLDPDAYRVDDWSLLVRVDGDTWPCCQRRDLDADQPDTFEVSYTAGAAPPVSGVEAVIALTVELLKAACNDDTCQLPSRVRSMTREGVTIDVVNPEDITDGGKTGVYLVDLFLNAVNPGRLRRGSRILSPDAPALGRHVST